MEAPVQPLTYWAIPFLSAQEAHQLYQMLDEDTKVRAKELISIYGVQFVDQTLTSQECQEYFGEGGLFEHARKITFKKSQIDLECFERLPRTLTDLTLRKNQLIHHIIHHETRFSEQIWVKVLESIAKTVPNLQSLNINLNRGSDRDWYVHFHEKATSVIAKKMISLKHLTIEAFIKKEATREIAQGNLTQLTHLDLTGNWIGSEGVKAIATGNLRNLTYLDLSVNNIEDEGIKLIAENMPQLTHLNLGFNQIGPKGAEAIFQGNLPNLTHLDFSFNQLGNAGAIVIARGNLGSLTHLDLSWNNIEEDGIQIINENLLPSLAFIGLSGNSKKENSLPNSKNINKLFKFLWD